jgi:hypothetical protein
VGRICATPEEFLQASGFLIVPNWAVFSGPAESIWKQLVKQFANHFASFFGQPKKFPRDL